MRHGAGLSYEQMNRASVGAESERDLAMCEKEPGEAETATVDEIIRRIEAGLASETAAAEFAEFARVAKQTAEELRDAARVDPEVLRRPVTL